MCIRDRAKEFNASIGNKYDGIERMHQDYEREEDEGFAVNPSGSSVKITSLFQSKTRSVKSQRQSKNILSLKTIRPLP